MLKMMGEQQRTDSLFYYFRLEDQIPDDHLLRLIDRHVDFSFVRERLRKFYSSTGRPSIDPEVLLRLLLVGYLYGITSERRLLEEVRMHLAFRWFSRLGFEQETPDHSTFSKNRHGRFRKSGMFRSVFEEIVRSCLAAGLVEGRTLAVDGTLVGANASQGSRVPRERLAEVAQVSRTVQEYLTELEQQNPVADQEARAMPQEMVSATDPDAAWAVKSGPATLGYYDNYLVDTASRVILAVEATPARFRQEALAARRMLEHVARFGIRPENLAADKAYGSGEFLSWLLERGIQPHIPVIDHRHQTQGRFTREQFRYDPKENVYYCPEGKPLRYRGLERKSQGDWGWSIPHRQVWLWLYITRILSATTNSGDDRNLRSCGDGARESTCISDVFVRDENVDVFPHLSLLRCDAIPNARVECPESRQRLSQGCGRVFDLDFTASSRKFA
jgi:transposase